MSDVLNSSSISNLYGRSLKIDLSAWVFWLTLILSFVASRPLIVATSGKYRLGLAVFALGLLLVLSRLRLVNWQLLISISLLGVAMLLSGLINNSSIVEVISFVRIPIIAYLVYYLVAAYLTKKERVISTFRVMYIIALIQLPILVIQRISYPYMPERLKFGVLTGQLSPTDFATGTFDGDASMSFLLIALLILLLFFKHSEEFLR